MKQFLLAIIFIAFTISSSQAQFAGGSGTEEDPYQVATVEQLQEILNHFDKHFIQIADIDASETVNWNDGKGFEPIGDELSGSYNGNGYIINYLYINRQSRVGLFYTITGALKNITLENVSINGGQHTGALVGIAQEQAVIFNSYVSGEVAGDGAVGGLVGINHGIIESSQSHCNVTGLDAGGLVGWNIDGEIIESSAHGIVTGSSGGEMAGGLVAYNEGTITNSFSTGNMFTDAWHIGGITGMNGAEGKIVFSFAEGNISDGGNIVGGLVGSNYGEIRSSYAEGNITGGGSYSGGLVGSNQGEIITSFSHGIITGHDGYIGGLVGSNRGHINNSYSLSEVAGSFINEGAFGGLVGVNSGHVNMSYAAGKVVDFDPAGGLIGKIEREGYVTTGYWDIESSELDNGIGSGASDGITGLTTEQMTGVDALENMTGFDFGDKWVLTESYPALNWQDVETYFPIPPYQTSLNRPADGVVDLDINVEFEWDRALLAQYYEFQVSENQEFIETIFQVDSLLAINFTTPNLSYSTTYYWRVRAVNEAGTGDWSDTWSFTTVEIPVPQAVSLHSPERSKILTNNNVTLQWEPALPSADSYTLEIARENAFVDVVQSSETSQSSLTLTNLDPYIKYYWRVKAENEYGEGPFSEASSLYITNRFISTNGEIVSGVSNFNEDVFFTSSKDDKVYSFDRTGKILWTVETGGALQSTIAVDQNGDIFVGSTDTRLYSFDKDGIPRWDRALGGTILTSPSIGNDDLIYVGISTGRFFAISKSDGNIEWSIQTGDEIVSSASVDSDGIVYFGSNDGNLYSVDQNGQLLWTYATDGAVTGSPALTVDGEIVFPSQDGSLYKLDNSGSLLWKFETDGAISSSPVISSNGIILFGSEDGNVYSVSESGELIWSYELDSPVNGTPALTAEGLLVIGSDDGIISVFNAEGELIRQLRTGGSIKAPVLINEDNSIHVSSTDGYVYILENLVPDIMSKQLLASDMPVHQWSTFKGNNRRTGNQADIIEVSADNPQTEDLPTVFELQQNYPNPFNPSTIISYSVPEQANVRIEIFNSLGQRVAILVNETKSAGWHDVTFDATGLSSGLYLYRMRTDQFVESRQMMLVK